jgi:hypothetical protein
MYVYVSVLEVRYRLLMQIVCVWVELTCNTLDCMCSPMYEIWGIWDLFRYHIYLYCGSGTLGLVVGARECVCVDVLRRSLVVL